MFNNRLRTLALFCISTLTTTLASAATHGVYFTGQLGYANTHNSINIADDINTFILAFDDDDSTLSSVDTLSNNGLAGRVAAGYQFSPHLAFELGYFQLPGKKVNGTYTIIASPNSHPALTSENDTLKLKQHAIDLTVKAILPLANHTNVYGKLGVAYLTTNVSGSSSFTLVSDTDTFVTPVLNFDFPDVAKRQWAPEAVVGVSYDVTPNISVDASWTHIQPLGSRRAGNIDFVALGAGYYFG